MSVAIRLLIADDSEIIRRTILRLLLDEPNIHITGEARNYPELERLLGESPADVVLMDLRMPGQDRFDPETFKAKLRGACVLAMSAWNNGGAVGVGAERLLDKATLASTLIPAIHECVRGTAGS
jgi:DNA-binding NarL/FixJ family response regulator